MQNFIDVARALLSGSSSKVEDACCLHDQPLFPDLAFGATDYRSDHATIPFADLRSGTSRRPSRQASAGLHSTLK